MKNKMTKKQNFAFKNWTKAITTIFLISLFSSVFAQEYWTYSYVEIEKIQDENMDYMKQIYKIIKDYPSFNYKFTLEDGKVTKVIVNGVDNEMDKKRLEVILFDLKSNINKIKNKQNRIGVFYTVDKPAKPKEGEKEFKEKINKKISYPEEAKEWGIEGTVFLKFVVDENGEIPFITASEDIATSQDYIVEELKEKAINAVKETSGDWKPGEAEGVKVASLLILPVSYDIKKDPSLPFFIR